MKPKLKIDIFQTGGTVTVGSPLQYTPTTTQSYNPTAFKSINLDRKIPDLSSADIPEIEGYTSDKENRIRKYNYYMNQVKGLAEYEYDSKAPQLIASANNSLSSVEQTRLKNEHDQGLRLDKEMKESKDEWLTKSDGTVGMKVLDDAGNISFQFLDLPTATSLLANGKGKKVMGASAFTLRNTEIDIDNNASSGIHDAMGFTSHAKAARDDVDAYSTDATNKEAKKGQGLSSLAGKTVGIEHSLSAIVGSGESLESNEQQYRIAVESAWNNISNASKAVFKNKAINTLDSLPNEVFSALGIKRNDLENIYKTAVSDPDSKRMLSNLINIRAKQLVSNQLSRKIGIKHSKENSIRLQGDLDKQRFGIGDWKEDKIGEWQMAGNGGTKTAFMQIGNVNPETGKGTKLTQQGYSVSEENFQKDGKQIPLYQNKSAVAALELNSVYMPDGTLFTEDQKQLINAGFVPDRADAIVSYQPYVNDKPMKLSGDVARYVGEYNKAVTNKDNDKAIKAFTELKKISVDEIEFKRTTSITGFVSDGNAEFQFPWVDNKIESIGYTVKGTEKNVAKGIYEEAFGEDFSGDLQRITLNYTMSNDFKLRDADTFVNKTSSSVANALINSKSANQTQKLGVVNYTKNNFTQK